MIRGGEEILLFRIPYRSDDGRCCRLLVFCCHRGGGGVSDGVTVGVSEFREEGRAVQDSGTGLHGLTQILGLHSGTRTFSAQGAIYHNFNNVNKYAFQKRQTKQLCDCTI